MSYLHETSLIPNAFLYRRRSNEPVTATSSLQHLNALRKYVASSSLGSHVASSFERLGGLRNGLSKDEREEKIQLENRRQILYLRMRAATAYDDWLACAEELDLVEGNNEWKMVDEYEHYDAAFVTSRLRRLEEARVNCDVERMLHLIRTEFSRHLGDMSNLLLYKHSHVGTKTLIDRYTSTALATVDRLLEISARTNHSREETSYILEQVASARQAFGRSALLLSGGATFGMSHIGVLKALFEAKILPRVISGASAGSIVCSVLCKHTDEEMPGILANFGDGNLDVFEERGVTKTLKERLHRILKFGTVFDIQHLSAVMESLLEDITFQEAYNRSRRVLNICVSSADLYELPRLLNYVTAPNVLVRSAVCASCSVPVLFSASSLLAKDPNTGIIGPWNPTPQQWIDGSVDNDLPMARLSEMFNVNNFIVSQVNPHVVPFLLKEEEFITAEAQDAHAPNRFRWLQTWTELARDEILFRMQELVELGVFPTTLTKLASVMSQKYSGDINIYPEISYSDFPSMLANPTPEFMTQAAFAGERATWPKMSRIRNHMAIELALDDAVHTLRTRVVFSPSQVNLRLNVLGAAPGRGRGANSRKHTNVSRSNESGILRDTNESPSSRSTPFHLKSLSTGSTGQVMPTIPGSPSPAQWEDLLSRVHSALPAMGRPSIADGDAYADHFDSANASGGSAFGSPQSPPLEDSLIRNSIYDYHPPPTTPPNQVDYAISSPTLSSPTLSIKMPVRSSQGYTSKTPERTHESED